MRAPGKSSILITLTALACGRPDVRVMCHNANCAGPADPSRDDTLESLSESLALEYDGKPLIDGVEIDVMWYGAKARCTFAHDGDSAPDAPDASEAGQLIADYLRDPAPKSFDGGPFLIRIELKGFVGDLGDEHSPAQAEAHAECALDLYQSWRSAAQGSGHSIVVIFDSAEPRLLRAVAERPRFSASARDIWLSADFVDSTPSGLALQKLEEFPEIDDVVFHAGWINSGHYHAFRSLDVNLTLWMFSATSETFDALTRLEPDVALTSEAPLLRRWLEY